MPRSAGASLWHASYHVGSWFAVRVMPRPGEVVVSLLGKPTLNGAELCSDADDLFADAQYWCKDTYARDLGSVGPLITGREEVDVVRGVLAELRNLVPARTL